MPDRTCSIDGCTRKYTARGFCRKHYLSHWRAGALPKLPLMAPHCQVEGCDRPSQARGWCSSHYARWRHHGDPLIAKFVRDDDDARFLSHIRVLPNGCHEWTGYRENGYGRFKAQPGTLAYAHRWAWMRANGPVPHDLPLDHYRHPEKGCIGPACANADHVRPVTKRENTLRSSSQSALNAAKTHCIHGHAFDQKNTYRYKGSRQCRTCKRAINARAKKSRRA